MANYNYFLQYYQCTVYHLWVLRVAAVVTRVGNRFG